MSWARFISWLRGFRCRRRGHRWIEVVNIMCARCCDDCGCGEIVNMVSDGQYRAGPIFLITGRACPHASVLKAARERAARVEDFQLEREGR